ncbi:hypothetical protein [Desulfocurvibacter africanus]|uniref:hypothetical protein n=1 Tax=Desulfocurvibacter africanus TaxID=873 RepID=UPI0004262E2E|nr:hypothetical protein [Desulfocurvibacter africanus]
MPEQRSPRCKAVLCLTFSMLGLVLAGCSGLYTGAAGERAEPAVAPASGLYADMPRPDLPQGLADDLASHWGVEVVALRHSAHGYMLDFRYRVLDAEKAKPLGDRRIKPQLIDLKSGAVHIVPAPPKIGSLRQTSAEMKEGRIYYIMFANPARRIQKGDRVSVVVGDFRADNLLVE